MKKMVQGTEHEYTLYCRKMGTMGFDPHIVRVPRELLGRAVRLVRGPVHQRPRAPAPMMLRAKGGGAARPRGLRPLANAPTSCAGHPRGSASQRQLVANARIAPRGRAS